MATLKTVIQKDKMRKDGTYNVKIRLTHRRETRWIATTTNVTPADLTRSGKLKNRTALLETDETINRYERALSEIGPFEIERMTAADLVEYLRKRENPDAGKEFRLDFLRWGEECAEKDKAGTRKIIKTSLNAFRRFAGSKIDINDITKNTVRGFIEFIRREPDARRTKAKRKGPGRPPADAKGEKRAWKGYCLTLRTIHERARRHFNDEDAGTILIPRRPFSVMNEYAYRTEGKRSIGRDGVQAIIDAEAVETDPKTRWALCCLILSFGLCGMNSADMTEAEAPSGGILTYRRKKTRDRRKDGALIKLKILPQLEYYARAVSGGNRLVDGYAGMTARYTNAVRYRTGIAASRAGFPPACPYALRHTWATLARSRECGVSNDVIDECLCHATRNALVDVYAERDWRNVWDAQEKVLSLFSWPRLGKPAADMPVCPNLKNRRKDERRKREKKQRTLEKINRAKEKNAALPSGQGSNESTKSTESPKTTEAADV